MDIVTLFMVGSALVGLAIGGFLLLIFLAILIYVVKNLYPPGRRLALWVAKLENFLPLLVLDIVLFLLIIFMVIFALRLPSIVALLLILLVLILLIVLVLVGSLVLMGIVVYGIRIVGWLYGRWKGVLSGLLPQIMKLKIKHEAGKDKDKNWTTHFAEMRKKLGEEADLARRRISKGGK